MSKQRGKRENGNKSGASRNENKSNQPSSQPSKETTAPAGDGGVLPSDADNTSPAGPSADSVPTIPAVTKYQRFEPRTILRSQITGAPYNPRVLTPAARRKLSHLIKKHGLVGGIVWNQRTGVLVGGHQRLSVIDDLEHAAGRDDYSITVDVVDIDPIEERELNVALNNQEAQGQFDFELLANVVGEVIEAGGKPESMGHDAASLHSMFGDSFFNQHIAEQEEAESPIIGVLHDIKEAGREANRESKGAASGSGGESPQRDVRLNRAGSDDLAEFEDEVEVEYNDDEHATDDGGGEVEYNDDEHDSDSADEPDSLPPAGDAGDAEARKAATKEALAARRKEYAASYAETNQTDTILTLVFETQDTLRAFMRALRLDDRKRAFDHRDLLESVDAVGAKNVLRLMGG